MKRQETKQQMLLRALEMAIHFHADSLDKSGVLYIFHPFRVADMARQLGLDEEAQAIGLLHDLAEDTTCKLELIYEVFGQRIGDGVDALTRRNKERAVNGIDETYKEFVHRVASNADARKIKPLDNADNMRPERIVKLDKSDFSLPKRYHKAIDTLMGACIVNGEDEYVRKFKELVTWV